MPEYMEILDSGNHRGAWVNAKGNGRIGVNLGIDGGRTPMIAVYDHSPQKSTRTSEADAVAHQFAVSVVDGRPMLQACVGKEVINVDLFTLLQKLVVQIPEAAANKGT